MSYDFVKVPVLNAAQVRQLCEMTDWVDSVVTRANRYLVYGSPADCWRGVWVDFIVEYYTFLKRGP